jgi:hypothetical protein
MPSSAPPTSASGCASTPPDSSARVNSTRTASSSRPSSRSSSETPAARTHYPPSETGPQPCMPSSSARTSASQPDCSPTWQYPSRWCSASATTTSVPISPATSPTCSYDLRPAVSRTRPTGPSGTGARRNNAHHRLRRARLVDFSRRRHVESTDPRPSTSPSVRREPRSGSRQHSKQGQHTKSQPSGSTRPGRTATRSTRASESGISSELS